MKKLWISFIAIALVAIVISCDDLEPTPQFRKSDLTFTVTPSATTVAVAASDSLGTAITLNWTDPGFSVGLSKSKFTVMVGAENGAFASFAKKEFSGVLSGALLAKEINAMALRFGGSIGQPITLDAKVVASQVNNNEPRESAVFKVNVTPYGDLTLSSSATAVVLSAANASQVGVSLSWTKAFNGFDGVKTYELQYAAGGTAFSSATTISVSTFTRSFNQFDLNKIALTLGATAGNPSPIDFRIKATNESGTLLYSNTATVSVTPYIAFNSIGIIGDGTPGGWNTDSDMYRPDASKPTEWSTIIYLTGGKAAKFRADDNWTDNWGANDFPSGTGVQNGANIPVSASGYYKVDFNVGSGSYTFSLLTTPTYLTIGIIGSGTPGGWSTDTDLTKDSSNPHIWTGTVTLTDGEAKFRAEDAWSVNWGAASFPSGRGVGNGPNISVKAGTYVIRLNDATGEYQFMPVANAQPYSAVGIIGSGTPGGWDNDTDLIQNPTNPYLWSKTITLTAAEAKFRANDAWSVNWGDSNFPGGIGTQNGPNIPTQAGAYFVTFNSGTGEYNFVK
jgi:hypothetical protein